MKKSNSVGFPLVVSAVACLLTSCGLAETTAVAASEAKSAAEQAKQGKELEDKVQRDVAAAEKAAADARAKTESESESESQ